MFFCELIEISSTAALLSVSARAEVVVVVSALHGPFICEVGLGSEPLRRGRLSGFRLHPLATFTFWIAFVVVPLLAWRRVVPWTIRHPLFVAAHRWPTLELLAIVLLVIILPLFFYLSLVIGLLFILVIAVRTASPWLRPPARRLTIPVLFLTLVFSVVVGVLALIAVDVFHLLVNRGLPF
jgi:hypothetical protein